MYTVHDNVHGTLSVCNVKICAECTKNYFQHLQVIVLEYDHEVSMCRENSLTRCIRELTTVVMEMKTSMEERMSRIENRLGSIEARMVLPVS